MASTPFETVATQDDNPIRRIDQNFLDKLDRIIRRKLGDGNFEVAQLAKEMNVSRRTLYRNTRRLLSMPPATYIREVRLSYVHKLLKQGHFATVGEVANAVGMSQTHLTKLYKARFGISPGKHNRRTT